MPMPDFSGEWPPAPYSAAQDAFNLWNSWLEGDTGTLEQLYRQWPNGMPPRASQFSTGLLGVLARFWYGRPQLQASTRRLHIPAPADVARTSADLLFGQKPQWVLNEGDATNLEAARDRLDQLLGGPDAVATLLEAAEIQAALGGVFLRLWYDVDVTDKVMLGAMAPDCAIPEWKYGKLSAVTFWTVVCDDKSGVWRHLERHEPGSISHALYKGDRGDIGRVMPLQDQDATEWAAELVDENSSIPTNVKGLTAAYVPNMRPSRMWRNTPGLSALGRSDFEGLEGLFDQLDAAYSSWMRDLDLAKARLFVAEDLLQDAGPGLGAMWDPEQAVFTPIPGATISGSMQDGMGAKDLIHAEQFEIRHAEHQATCQALMNRILVSAGYSVADFGDDQLAGAMTATEVSARKSLSNQTRAKKALYWSSAMSPLARTMLEFDQAVFGGDYGIQADPEMKFPVRVDQDPVQVSTTIANLRAAQAMSIEEAVREYHPNWSVDEVDEEVDRIRAEQPAEADAPIPDLEAVEPVGTPEAHADLQGSTDTDTPVLNEGDAVLKDAA